MGKIVAPYIVENHFTTQTIQGEVTINLNLTIKIDQDGEVEVSTQSKNKTKFELPDLEMNSELIDFGQDV